MVTLKREAVHEAGHCAACIWLGFPILHVSIGERAYLRRGGSSSAKLQRLAVVCLAGPAAEKAFFGSVPKGCCVTDERMAFDFLMRHLFYAPPDKVEPWLRHARGVAGRLVRSPWGKWHINVIADALLRRGMLTGDEIRALCR
jgi:hypothetical protein